MTMKFIISGHLKITTVCYDPTTNLIPLYLAFSLYLEKGGCAFWCFPVLIVYLAGLPINVNGLNVSSNIYFKMVTLNWYIETENEIH